MKFKYKSIRILGEASVGSGQGYTVRQTQYDLNSVQDHEVDVPLSGVFLDSGSLGCAGMLAMLLAIPIGLIALLSLYQQLPAAGTVLTTFAIVAGICTAIIYPIMCFRAIRPAAFVAAMRQRNAAPGDKFDYVPAEEWDSFVQRIQASTAKVQAQTSRFDAIERHGNRPN